MRELQTIEGFRNSLFLQRSQLSLSCKAKQKCIFVLRKQGSKFLTVSVRPSITFMWFNDVILSLRFAPAEEHPVSVLTWKGIYEFSCRLSRPCNEFVDIKQ